MSLKLQKRLAASLLGCGRWAENPGGISVSSEPGKPQTYIWRFPKSWGYPQLSSMFMGFSLINHPAIGGIPMETPISMAASHGKR